MILATTLTDRMARHEGPNCKFTFQQGRPLAGLCAISAWKAGQNCLAFQLTMPQNAVQGIVPWKVNLRLELLTKNQAKIL